MLTPCFPLLALYIVAGADDAARAEHFEKRIRPIFAANCVGCHGIFDAATSFERRCGGLTGADIFSGLFIGLCSPECGFSVRDTGVLAHFASV